MTDRPRAVNVHAHFLIPGDLQLARAAGEGSYAGPTDGVWSPEIATTFMDAHHIQMQMQRLRRVSGGRAPRAFRDARQHPLRDPDHDAALREIDRAADDLRADGFVLVTNYGGRYLGDPSFEPVFAALDQRRAPAFIHPVNPAGFSLVSCGCPGPLIEYPMDTAHGGRRHLGGRHDTPPRHQPDPGARGRRPARTGIAHR